MSGKKALEHMGKVIRDAQVVKPGMPRRRARRVILLLAACMALQMTGFGIIFPLFARRLGEFGDGVEALAVMTMAYSLASIVASPFMGSLADRFGRRPMLLGSLAVYAVAFIGYLLAASTGMFIGIRAVAGALTAGLAPATMGIIADISPEDELARWIGIVGGGTSAGLIAGPILGGVLYDQWGYVVPFAAAAGMTALALLAAFFTIPETYTQEARRRETLRQRRAAEKNEGKASEAAPAASFWASLPRPLTAFSILLFINLSMIFAWFFIDPQLPFYVFDDLGWTTAQFGISVSVYGWASLLGQTALGQLSDRFGRKPIIIVGLLLHGAQYVGLMLTDGYVLLLIAFILAGLGEALVLPALNASFLDMTPEQHRARVMGIKTAAASLGSLSAPALVMVVIRYVSPQSVFTTSAALIAFTALLVLVALRLPSRVAVKAADLTWEASQERTMAAQASLRGVVLSAGTARKLKEGGGGR